MIRELFEREVEYLWSWLARAGRRRDEEFASLVSRDGDPRVTRLVQAAAYAFARVRERLEDDVPDVSHALVASALPEVLRPTPAATIVQVQDARRTQKHVLTLDAGTALESRPIDGVPCLFGTSWPAVAAPIHLARAAVRASESGVQLLTLRLEPYPEASLRSALPDALRVFVETQDPILALDVVHAVTKTRAPVRIRALDARGLELSAQDVTGAAPTWTALEGAFSLAPGPSDRFGSGTALRALFAFPEVFAFFDLNGLQAVAKRLPEAARALEITLRLEGTVTDAAMDAAFHLSCAPAVNVFETDIVPLPIRSLGPCGSLEVPGHPERELFHLAEAGIVPNDAPEAVTPVRLWESYRSHAYLDEELYLQIARRAPPARGPTELRGTLLRPSGGGTLRAGILQARGLATDGCRAEALLKGDVGAGGDNTQLRNITRVSAPRAVPLDARLPWRANAYARMPVAQFGQAASLAGYLDIHDVTGARRTVTLGVKPAAGGIVSAARSPVKRVDGDEVFLGDQVDLLLDDAVFGGPGATWLVGELLARAITERSDFLRYTRTRLVHRDGSARADYGVRQGDRLPPPLG